MKRADKLLPFGNLIARFNFIIRTFNDISETQILALPHQQRRVLANHS